MVVALLGAIIRPDHSENANEQLISIAKPPPLTKVDVLLVAKNKVIVQKRWWLLLANGGQEPLYETVPIDGMQLQGNRLKVKVKNTSDIEEYPYFLLADVVYPLADESLQKVVHESESKLELKDLYGEIHQTSNEEFSGIMYYRI